jgi:hypothetical protein
MSNRSIRWLLSELPGLVADGVLDEDAAEKLSERYALAAAGSGARPATGGPESPQAESAAGPPQ